MSLETVMLIIILTAENFKRIKRLGFHQIFNQIFGNVVDVGNPIRMAENSETARFFDMIEKRSDKTVTDWLDTMDIPIITVDGTQAIEESIAQIIKKLNTKCVILN